MTHERDHRTAQGRSVLAGAAMFSTLLLVAACGSDPVAAPTPTDTAWAAVVEAAKAEGTVSWYSSNTPQKNDALAQAFQQRYPDIKVEITRITTPELKQRVEAEYAANQPSADVVTTSDQPWSADHESWWQKATGPEVASLSQDLVTADGTVVGTGGDAYGFGWNTDEISGSLTLMDLTKPEYKGRIATYDPAYSDTYVTLYLYYKERFGESFLTALGANDPLLFQSTAPMMQAVGSGQVDAAVFATKGSTPEGAPIQLAYPDSPLAIPFVAQVTARAAHPNAAQVFLDFLVSREGQAIWTAGGVSVRGDVTEAQFKNSDVTFVDLRKYDKATLDQARLELENALK